MVEMDTRAKIAGLAQAEAILGRLEEQGRSMRVVKGSFDPLTAAHARRIEEISDPRYHLMALLTTPTRPLLAARARAELVAALARVDTVLLLDEREAAKFLAHVPAAAVIDEQAADERRRSELIAQVLERQRAQ